MSMKYKTIVESAELIDINPLLDLPTNLLVQARRSEKAEIDWWVTRVTKLGLPYSLYYIYEGPGEGNYRLFTDLSSPVWSRT